ncbi:MAG: inositol monophosphatase family protein [Lentisphaerota bacterium]
MKDWNMQQLLPLLKQCGQIAMKYYDNPPCEVKADNTIVTMADKEIEALLAKEFDRPDEGVYLIGEETIATRNRQYHESAMREICWIVDPIDGTAPYSIHLPAWGVSIGYMRNGIIEEGLLYMPATNELTITDGLKVFCAKGLPENFDLQEMQFIKRPFDNSGVIGISQKAAKAGKFDLSNQLFAWSGCVASFQNLFTGRLLAYVVGGKIWDVAGAIPIMQRGGYRAVNSKGVHISTDIRNGCFNLDFDDHGCWRLNGHAVIASDETTVNYIYKHMTMPE